MRKDLPENLPMIVRDAAARARQELTEASRRKSRTLDAYARHRELARQEMSPDLRDGEAMNLFTWAMKLRRALLFDELRVFDLFTQQPPLSIVSHEIVLAPVGEIPGGRLKTELELDFFDRDRFLNHHEWFDGYRVGGGGTLNTVDAIHTALFPVMLRQIHDLVAEGQVWDRIIHGFGKLVEAYKDR